MVAHRSDAAVEVAATDLCVCAGDGRGPSQHKWAVEARKALFWWGASRCPYEANSSVRDAYAYNSAHNSAFSSGTPTLSGPAGRARWDPGELNGMFTFTACKERPHVHCWVARLCADVQAHPVVRLGRNMPDPNWSVIRHLKLSCFTPPSHLSRPGTLSVASFHIRVCAAKLFYR